MQKIKNPEYPDEHMVYLCENKRSKTRKSNEKWRAETEESQQQFEVVLELIHDMPAMSKQAKRNADTKCQIVN